MGKPASLTDVMLKALKAKDGEEAITDGSCPGLSIFKRSTGGMSWIFRYQWERKPEKIILGKYPAISLKEARLLGNETASLLAKRINPKEQRRLAKTEPDHNPTVAQFAERFFRDVVEKDRKNPAPLHRALERDILSIIGTKPMREVTADDLRRVIWAKKEQGFDKAAGLLHGQLKRLCDYAISFGLLQGNPISIIRMRDVTKNKPRERNLSANELGIVIRAINGSVASRPLVIALHLIILTMCRKAELLKARWENVHMDLATGPEWHIPARDSKTGKPHVVFLSRQATVLFDELQGLAGDCPLVLPGRWSMYRAGEAAKPYAEPTLNRVLESAMAGKGVEAFTIHDFRRTAATLLREAGFMSDVIQKALNHSIGGIAAVYDRYEFGPQRREMLQAWADIISNY
jgi:integrase